MSSLQGIQTLMNKNNVALQEELESLRVSLEQLQEDNIRSARSLGQIRRAVRDKMKRIQQLYDELLEQQNILKAQNKSIKDGIRNLTTDIPRKIKMYNSDPDFTTDDILTMYKGYIPAILIMLERLLEI